MVLSGHLYKNKSSAKSSRISFGLCSIEKQPGLTSIELRKRTAGWHDVEKDFSRSRLSIGSIPF